eukprot:2585626-Prymnesium_polylepis.1
MLPPWKRESATACEIPAAVATSMPHQAAPHRIPHLRGAERKRRAQRRSGRDLLGRDSLLSLAGAGGEERAR